MLVLGERRGYSTHLPFLYLEPEGRQTTKVRNA